jgi:hypothetical protein
VTRAAGLLFIGFVVVELLRFIVYAPRVNAEVLCAAVAGFLLSGFAWSLAYNLLDRLDPDSFVFTPQLEKRLSYERLHQRLF